MHAHQQRVVQGAQDVALAAQVRDLEDRGECGGREGGRECEARVSQRQGILRWKGLLQRSSVPDCCYTMPLPLQHLCVTPSLMHRHLLALHDVSLGQRLDGAHPPTGAVPCKAHAPKAAGS